MISLQDLVKEIKELKPIPAVASRLVEAVDSTDCSMTDIANIIQYDPVVTANVLRTCNSAYFGLKNPAESIKDAVNMLGTDQVVQLALLKSGTQALSGAQKGYKLKRGEMWRYSVASALLAKQVAGKLLLKNKNTVFTAALIKDIGKVMLEKYVGQASAKITELVENQGFSFVEAEKKVLGIDHAELGAMIVKMWHFSPLMVNIIRHHHLQDEEMVKRKETAAVYLSDCICMMLGFGVGSDGMSYRFKEKAMTQLGISADDISIIIAEFGIHIQEVEELLQMTKN